MQRPDDDLTLAWGTKLELFESDLLLPGEDDACRHRYEPGIVIVRVKTWQWCSPPLAM